MERDSVSGGMRHGSQGDNNGKLVQNFQRSFVQVQSILDQNRLLINEINQNQASRAPAELTRNVGLIRELNTNIWRVVDLYAGLSASFTGSMEPPSEGDSPASSKAATSGKRVRLG
ncbi:hypothetical protein Taro_029491 [Colocasia esculenta]|uniref:Protein EARLY FLOWERING 4 domain-containing protein n=1 Tax=Colocasia esculenta TaxID=4460 RepID=A0A843VP71_COLES|nr:hypothetical protein [Colocasia esculenta]